MNENNNIDSTLLFPLGVGNSQLVQNYRLRHIQYEIVNGESNSFLIESLPNYSNIFDGNINYNTFSFMPKVNRKKQVNFGNMDYRVNFSGTVNYAFVGQSTNVFKPLKKLKYKSKLYSFVTTNYLSTDRLIKVDEDKFVSENELKHQLFFEKELIVSEDVKKVFEEYFNFRAVEIEFSGESYTYYICKPKLCSQDALMIDESIYYENSGPYLVHTSILIYPCINVDMCNDNIFSIKEPRIINSQTDLVESEIVYFKEDVLNVVSKFGLQFNHVDRAFSVEKTKEAKGKNIELNLKSIYSEISNLELNHNRIKLIKPEFNGKFSHINYDSVIYSISKYERYRILRNILLSSSPLLFLAYWKLFYLFIILSIITVLIVSVAFVKTRGIVDNPTNSLLTTKAVFMEDKKFNLVSHNVNLGILRNFITVEVPIEKKSEYVTEDMVARDTILGFCSLRLTDKLDECDAILLQFLVNEFQSKISNIINTNKI